MEGVMGYPCWSDRSEGNSESTCSHCHFGQLILRNLNRKFRCAIFNSALMLNRLFWKFAYQYRLYQTLIVSRCTLEAEVNQVTSSLVG